MANDHTGQGQSNNTGVLVLAGIALLAFSGNGNDEPPADELPPDELPAVQSGAGTAGRTSIGTQRDFYEADLAKRGIIASVPGSTIDEIYANYLAVLDKAQADAKRARLENDLAERGHRYIHRCRDRRRGSSHLRSGPSWGQPGVLGE